MATHPKTARVTALRDLTAKPVVLDVPQRITNASSREKFTGIRWEVRPGGEDHRQYRSRGLGAA